MKNRLLAMIVISGSLFSEVSALAQVIIQQHPSAAIVADADLIVLATARSSVLCSVTNQLDGVLWQNVYTRFNADSVIKGEMSIRDPFVTSHWQFVDQPDGKGSSALGEFAFDTHTEMSTEAGFIPRSKPAAQYLLFLKRDKDSPHKTGIGIGPLYMILCAYTIDGPLIVPNQINTRRLGSAD